jgi:hypothetical protein
MRNDSTTYSIPKANFTGRHRRKLQIVLTVITGFIGAGMVVGAWFSIGHIHGEAVINLAMLGIVIPACISAMFAVRDWHDTMVAGGELGRFATWCTRTKMNQILPVASLFLILSLAHNLNNALDRPYSSDAAPSDAASLENFETGMRRECVSSGMASLGKAANGPQSTQLHSRVESYCGCVATGLEAAYSMAELNAMAVDRDRMTHYPKVRGVIAACQREAAR